MCNRGADWDKLDSEYEARISQLEQGDRESCGCQWYRGEIEVAGVVINGDHLLQCEGHKAGTAPPLPGSEPDEESFEELLDMLHDGGYETVVPDGGGVAGGRPFDD